MQIDLLAERARLVAELEEAGQRYHAARGALAFIDRLLAQLQAEQQQPTYTEGDDPPPEPPKPASTFLEG